MLAAVAASPPYRATIECLPTPNEDVLHTAAPAAFNLAEPSAVPPSTKLTVPVGGFVSPDTCAVSVTISPATAGLALAEIVVIDDASGGPTTSSNSPLVEPAEFAFPAY